VNPVNGVLFVFAVTMQIIGEERPAMLVIMAIDTEVFPIAAILRVIEMVAVPVVDCEKMKIVQSKFAAAFGADPPVKLE
jgi:hypothetical protein